MADVFVSYKAEDRRRVSPLVHALETEGFSVWWDKQIGGGDEWRRSIEEHLDAARCVIVVWSRRSIGSEGQFVRDEAMRAQRHGTYLPLLIDKVEPPLGFGERQAISLVRWNGDRGDRRFEAVVAAVRAIGSGQAPPKFANPAPSLVGRRGVIAGAGAVIVAAATGAWFVLRPRAPEASDSIAVMPFDNLSGDPRQAYFSDGMAEELRSALSRIPQLKVVARTSSEAVRNEDAKTAARKLGVANILTGSVRRSSTLIRVSTQLVDGTTGLERWSQEFDRPLGDTLAIQSNIAQSVAGALRIELGRTTQAALVLGGTRNPAAQDLYLKTGPRRESDSAEGVQRSIATLDAAIEIDPGYAQAFARKASLLAFYGASYARSPSDQAANLNAAVDSARRAIALAPDLAQAHAALGFSYKLQLKFKDALRELQIASALPGADGETLRKYATALAQCNRPDEAQMVAQHAISIDPLNPQAFESQAIVLFLAHRFPETAAAATHALELDPSGVVVRGILAFSFIMMGRYDKARVELAKLPPDSWQAMTGRAIVAARTRDKEGFDEAVKLLHASMGDASNYEFAEIFAQRGDADTAIGYLKKPVAQRDPGFIFIRVDPFLDPIRGDPRLQQIIKELNFPN